jgi:glucoamylase
VASSHDANGSSPKLLDRWGARTGREFKYDEIGYPMILARQLRHQRALEGFDPYLPLKVAAAYLIAHGPVTGDERWEESQWVSPSTLVVVIAGLICTAGFARDNGDNTSAQFIR